jgi:gluconokinase
MTPHPDGPLVLALDIGTSSARAMLFDSSARALEETRCQIEHRPDHDQPGQSTFDADPLVDTAAHCIDGALAAAGRMAERVAAVGVTTFWHSMVGVNARGAAVTPLITWADTRSADAARALKTQLDAAAVHDRTGCALHSSYFPARLAWLRETAPVSFHDAAHWLSPGEFLFLRLFGETACSVSMASGTGLLDQNARQWDPEMLAASGIRPDQLAPLTDIDRPARGLRSPWAERWPVLARVPWTPAIGDGAASNLGSGCATVRRIAINLGTSGAIRVMFEADRVSIPRELWCYHLDHRRFVMGGAFSDGGSVAEWMRDSLGLPDLRAALREIAGREPDSHGLTFLPFLSGERSTGWRPEARATLHGLSLATTPTDILHAGMEAVALRFALVHRVIRRAFPAAEEVVASGGGVAESPVWARMIADALGVPVTVAEEREATSRGAAIVALTAAGVLRDVADAPPLRGTVVEPESARHAALSAALERQQELYRRLADWEF